MARFFAQRLAHLLGVLLAVSVLVFLLIHLSGDPIRLLTPLDAKPEDIERVRRLYGLDRSIPAQYWDFLRRAVRGDLGESFRFQQPAMTLVLQRLPATALLALGAVGVTIAAGIPLGVWIGSRAAKPQHRGQGNSAELIGTLAPTHDSGESLSRRLTQSFMLMT